MIQYHVQATSITNLVSCALFVVVTSLKMPVCGAIVGSFI